MDAQHLPTLIYILPTLIYIGVENSIKLMTVVETLQSITKN